MSNLNVVEFIKVKDLRDDGVTFVDDTAEKMFTLEKVFINPDFVVLLEETSKYDAYVQRGSFPDDLNKNVKFSRVLVNEGGYSVSEYVVIGTPSDFTRKTRRTKKAILNG